MCYLEYPPYSRQRTERLKVIYEAAYKWHRDPKAKANKASLYKPKFDLDFGLTDWCKFIELCRHTTAQEVRQWLLEHDSTIVRNSKITKRILYEKRKRSGKNNSNENTGNNS